MCSKSEDYQGPLTNVSEQCNVTTCEKKKNQNQEKPKVHNETCNQVSLVLF